MSLKMEDYLNYLKKKNDRNLFENGRRPQTNNVTKNN
jgi:hypothetical protein